MPGASRSGVLGLWNGAVKVAVHAHPEAGRANRELIETLARALGVRRSEIELTGGERSRDKHLRIPLAAEEARRRLLALLA
jgi:hypothetical protein